MFKNIFREIKYILKRNSNIRKINKHRVVNYQPFSKETRQAIKKREREWRKAERKGLVVYDDIRHIAYIKKEGEEDNGRKTG